MEATQKQEYKLSELGFLNQRLVQVVMQSYKIPPMVDDTFSVTLVINGVSVPFVELLEHVECGIQYDLDSCAPFLLE